MTDQPKPTPGGKRPGSGRPKKPATVMINFRIEKTRKEYLQKEYKGRLAKMFRAWQETL